MDPENNQRPRGCCRGIREFFGDYRLRVHFVGGYQFGLGILYLVAAIFQLHLIWNELSIWWKTRVLNKNENGTLNEFKSLKPAVDLMSVIILYFWMGINVLAGLLQIYSSVLILRATRAGTAELTAIRSCAWAFILNLGLVFYEIVMLVFTYDPSGIELVFELGLYRIWFLHDLPGLRKMLWAELNAGSPQTV